MEYLRISSEYNSIKKRSLINYFTNEKLNLEQHFHNRTVNMLRQIQNFESQNLKGHLKEIAVGSFSKVQAVLKD